MNSFLVQTNSIILLEIPLFEILCLFSGKKSKTGKILAIVLPIVAALLASATICFCCWRRRTKATKLSLSCKLQETEIVEILSKISLVAFLCNEFRNHREHM